MVICFLSQHKHNLFPCLKNMKEHKHNFFPCLKNMKECFLLKGSLVQNMRSSLIHLHKLSSQIIIYRRSLITQTRKSLWTYLCFTSLATVSVSLRLLVLYQPCLKLPLGMYVCMCVSPRRFLLPIPLILKLHYYNYYFVCKKKILCYLLENINCILTTFMSVSVGCHERKPT